MDSSPSLDWLLPQVIDFAGVGYSVQTVTQQQIHWSPALERLYGIAPGSFAGSFEAFIQLVHEDDRDYVRHECWRAIAQRSHYSLTCRTAHQPYVWVQHRGQLVFEGQQLTHIIEVVTDVTDFHLMQRTLLDPELRWDALMEHSDCLVLQVSEDGSILDALPSHLLILGEPSAALPSRNLKEFINPVDYPAFQQAWQQWQRGESATIRLHCISGVVEATGRRAAIASQCPSVILTLRDGSRALAVENRLQAQTQRLKSILDHQGAAVFRCRPHQERSVELVSAAVALISQYPVAEFLQGRGLMSLCHPEDQALLQATLREAIATLTPYQVDYRWVTAEGLVRWVAEQGQPVVNDQGMVVAVDGMIWDISDRQVQQTQMERDRSLLETILESTADGILAIDTQTKAIHFNSRFLKIWSLSAEFINHASDWQLVTFMTGQLSNPDAFWEQVRQETLTPDLDGHGWVEFKDGRRFERYSFPQWLEGKIVGRVISYRESFPTPAILD
jgi:PAS domain S-box-containing protein